MNRSKLARTTLLAVPMISAFVWSEACSWSCEGGDDCFEWDVDPAVYISSISFPPGSAGDEAVRQTLDRWNKVRGSSIDFNIGLGGYTDAEEIELSCSSWFSGWIFGVQGPVIIYLTQLDSEDEDTMGLCTTCRDANGFGDDILGAYVRVDSPSDREWRYGAPNPLADEPLDINNPELPDQYFQPVLSHELGHALGLEHDTGAPRRMHANNPFGGWVPGVNRIRVDPLPDDRRGVRAIYQGTLEELDVFLSNFYGFSSNAMLVPPPLPLVSRGKTGDCVNVKPGDSVLIYFNIGNAGTCDVWPAEVRFFLSSNNRELSDDDNDLGALWFDLPAGSMGYSFSHWVSIPAMETPGRKFIISQVSLTTGAWSCDLSEERYSSNNTLASPGCLQVLP